jgi:hypothetical protein
VQSTKKENKLELKVLVAAQPAMCAAVAAESSKNKTKSELGVKKEAADVVYGPKPRTYGFAVVIGLNNDGAFSFKMEEDETQYRALESGEKTWTKPVQDANNPEAGCVDVSIKVEKTEYKWKKILWGDRSSNGYYDPEGNGTLFLWYKDARAWLRLFAQSSSTEEDIVIIED